MSQCPGQFFYIYSMFLRSGLPVISAHPSTSNKHLIASRSLVLAVAVIGTTGVLENIEETTAKLP